MEPLSFWQMKKLYGWRMFAIGYFAIFHLLAISAFWFFSWSGLIIAISLYFIAGMGITVGFHRLLTHRAFETPSWVRRTFAILGSLTLQSSPLIWVSVHRMHHQYSDHDNEKDPHSPRQGPWWSHILWIIVACPKKELDLLCEKYSPDLLKDPFISRISIWTTVLLQVILGLILAVGGWLFDGIDTAISWVLWGVFFRVVFSLHATWMVNSITHLWGYRNYDTPDKSTNNPIIAALAWGEGWHNNHHEHPTAANHGQRWWEVDISYCLIYCMRLTGLAWNVRYQKFDPH